MDRKITSADCVDAIVAFDKTTSVMRTTSAKEDWKRISKRNDGPDVIRLFENRDDGTVLMVVERLGELTVSVPTAKDYKIVFVAKMNEDDAMGEGPCVSVCATPLDYFKKEGACDDIGLASDIICKLGFDSPCEALFEPEDRSLTLEQVRAKLLEAGCIEDPGFTAFMNDCDW